jgi:hypothetical protein
MIHQSKFVELIKVLDECLTVMSREAFHSDKESLEEVENFKIALKSHKEELELILKIDLSDKINFINPITVGLVNDNFIANIAAEAYADAENTVQQVKTFLRRKI